MPTQPWAHCLGVSEQACFLVDCFTSVNAGRLAVTKIDKTTFDSAAVFIPDSSFSVALVPAGLTVPPAFVAHPASQCIPDLPAAARIFSTSSDEKPTSVSRVEKCSMLPPVVPPSGGLLSNTVFSLLCSSPASANNGQNNSGSGWPFSCTKYRGR